LNVQALGDYKTYTAHGEQLLFTITELAAKVTAVARRLLGAANLPYRLETELGDPAHIIARTAEAASVQEIVIGRHGTSRLASLVLGSVAYKLIHHTVVPVTIVGPPRGGEKPPPTGLSGAHRVLLPLDGSEHAARAVDYVCSLGHLRIPLEVELLHASLTMPSVVFPDQEAIDVDNRAQGEAVLQAAGEALRSAGMKFDVRVAPGQPVEKIVEAVERQDYDRIVMGTRGLGVMANVLLGSVAYQVVHLSPVPVTLVK
jgi:nucleotide-binding universal stress UspA family protein